MAQQNNRFIPPQQIIPDQTAVDAMVDNISNSASDFAPLSDPTNALPTSENILPFNGQEILDPVPVNLPGPSVKKNIVGSPDRVPGGIGVPSKNDVNNFLQARIRQVGDESTVNQYAETFQYDAGPKTDSFYKRYAAYGNDVLSEVGFHPMVNNEANFVQRTTLWDDASRMMTDSFPVLFKRGFIDGPKSLGKALMGDYDNADLEDAREYEEAAAIGMSSRKGVGAFFNNTVMNFGYTAGIISEAIIEELAMSAMTLGSAGTTAGVQAARTGALGQKIVKALGKFGSGYKAVRNLLPKISKTPTAARGYWTSLRTAGAGGLRILNPLENTVDAARAIRKQNRAFKLGKADSYINGLGIASKTVGSLYRDVRALNMAISEARLEAGMVENDIFKEVYDDFVNTNKRAPNTEEQVGMRIRAKQGSIETFYSNAGIIYVTNQITFRNVVAPKGGIRNFMKNIQKDLYSVDGKYGTLGKVIYDRGKEAFRFQKNNLRELAKSWYRQPGYRTLAKTLGYFKANVSEGIQENLQETIARANIAHYVDAYKKEGVSSALLARGVTGVAYSAQMGTSADKYFDELSYEFSSAQGFETFMSGFMMGTFAKPLNNAVPFFSKHYNRRYNPEGYKDWMKRKTEQTEKVVDQLNKFSDKKGMGIFLDNRIFNLAVQEEVENILEKGGKYEALNAHLDAFVKSVSLMRRTNTQDVFIEKLEHMLELSDKELTDAVNSLDESKAPEYRTRINKAIDTLKNVDAIAKEKEKLFPNPVNLDLLNVNLKNFQEDPELRAKLLLHEAWNQSVENFVYLNAAFVDTAKRMEDMYATYLQDTALANVDYGAIKVLFKQNDTDLQLQILRSELKNQEPNSKKARETKKQIELLENFAKAKAKFNAVYNIDEYYDDVRKTLIQEAEEKAGKKDFKPTAEEVIERGDKLSQIYVDQQDDMLKELYDAHNEYVRYLAKINGATVFQSHLDQGFNKLVDFYKLSYENRFLANSIDLLTDPGEFLKLVTENEKVIQKINDQKKDIHKEVIDREDLDAAIKALINELENIGLEIDPIDLLNLRDNRVVPPKFLKPSGEEVPPNTPEYNAGLVFVNRFLEDTAVNSTTVNPVTKQPVATTMKDSVAKIRKLIAKSTRYRSSGGNYILGNKKFERVSNVISELINEKYEYGRMKDLMMDPLSPFNRIFYGAKENEDGKIVKGPFKFTEKNVDRFIKYLTGLQQRAKDTKTYNLGLDPSALEKLKAELLALVKKENRPSIQSQIDKIQEEINSLPENSVEIAILQAEISKLEPRLVIEPTETNVKKIMEEVLPIFTYTTERTRGDNLDAIVRDYFDSDEINYKDYEKIISKAAFDNLFGEKGILKPLKDAQLAGDIMIFSKDLTIGSADLANKKNVAGTMDLVVVDKNGQVYVIDLKTANQSSWDFYDRDGSFQAVKFVKHHMQTLGYSNILYNEEGIEAIPLVLGIATEEEESGKITVAELPEGASAFERSKKDTIVKGKLFIDMNRQVKGKPVKIELSERAGFPEGTVVDVNDIDIAIPRKDRKPPKSGSTTGPTTSVEFSKSGNVITLKNKKTIDENFISDYLGKFLYVTLGVGGYQLAQNNDDIIHTDDLFREELKNIDFKLKQNEALNAALYRFTKEGKISKTELNAMVLDKVRDLIAEGKTVITGTLDFIKSVSEDSAIIVTNLKNENFLESFENEDQAIKFMEKENLAIQDRNTNFVYLDFIDQIQESTDTKTLYKNLGKQKLSISEIEDLRLMIDVKANRLLSPGSTNILNTNKFYTFINDVKSENIQSGDQVKVIAIDSKGRKVLAKKTVSGKTTPVEMSYSTFVKAINLADTTEDTDSTKDKKNSDAVKNYLNSLGAELDKIDGKKKSFDDFKNMSDEDKYNKYKCG